MKPFSSASITPEDTVFIDKFSLKIKLGDLDLNSILVDEREDEDSERSRAYAILISNLGRPPLVGARRRAMHREQNQPYRYSELRHCALLSDSNLNQDKGWLFNSRNIAESHSVQDKYKLIIASSPHVNVFEQEVCPKPLFGGNAYCDKSDGVTLDLNLNLATYFRYNNPHRRMCRDSNRSKRRGSRIACYSTDRPYLDRSENPSVGEYSYDGRVNWFDSNDVLGWPTVRRRLRDYIKTVERAVEQEFERATSGVSHVQVNNLLEVRERIESKYDLVYSEVAWEFSSDNPQQLVRELQPVAESYRAAGAVSRDYHVHVGNGDTEDGWNKSLNIDLSQGCTLAIYAKTNRRVRVEVRYRLKQYVPQGLRGGRKADQYSGIAYKFDRLREDAEAKVNAFLAFVKERQCIIVSPTSASVVQLVLDVWGHCGGHNRELAENLLYELGSDGYIRLARGGCAKRREIVKRMKTHVPRILDRSSRGEPYRPREQYQWAVRKLSESSLWEAIVNPPRVTRRRRVAT